MRSCVFDKLRGNRVEVGNVADRGTADHTRAPMPHVTDDAISGSGKPQLDPWIQELVRRGIPTESKD